MAAVPPIQDGWGGTPTTDTAVKVGAGGSTKKSRSRDRSRERSRRDRDRSRSRSRDRDRDRSRRSRRSRSRSRSRSRGRRRRRDRDRSDSSSDSDRRHKKKAKKKKKKKKRKSNFDVGPNGADMSAVKASGLVAGAGIAGAPGIAVPAFVPPTPSMQQTRHARRLYVGGVPETSDQALMAFFNEKVQASLVEPMPGGAVVSVYLNLERKFAFVEFKTIELTTACLALDGIAFQHANLAVRRPSDYQPAMVPPSNAPVPQLDLSQIGLGAGPTAQPLPGGVLATRIPNGPGKIYLGGLPYSLAEGDVRPFLEAFGPLKALCLMRDPGMTTTKGWGFCEYQDVSITSIACQALNGTALGDRQLIMRPANNSGSTPGASILLSGMSGSQLATMTLASAATASNTTPLGVRAPVAGMPEATPATNVLALMNMVGEEDLQDQAEIQEIKEDIRGECAKFGTVKSIKIPTPGQPGVGKVFVEYAEASEALQASHALAGRTFGAKTVATEFLDPAKYSAGDFA